jgi:hypothetical protein
VITGCVASRRDVWTGPSRAANVDVQPWTSHGTAPAFVLQSPRYRIYTTLPDGSRRSALPQVLEGAYAQYHALAPTPMLDDRPMSCFVFAQREEWAEFTARKTGQDAAMYLQIPRGGYTIDDWFVAYSDSDHALFSAAAHEGWHQYVARHFRGRLPPFLEEGVACLFEDVRMNDGLPRWNLAVNPDRTTELTKAAKNLQLWPLEQLIAMHAGDVVDQPQERIDAFYAQDWAFARFLLEAEGGRYRPMFQLWLAETAAGTAFAGETMPSRSRTALGSGDRPSSARTLPPAGFGHDRTCLRDVCHANHSGKGGGGSMKNVGWILRAW